MFITVTTLGIVRRYRWVYTLSFIRYTVLKTERESLTLRRFRKTLITEARCKLIEDMELKLKE